MSACGSSRVERQALFGACELSPADLINNWELTSASEVCEPLSTELYSCLRSSAIGSLDLSPGHGEASKAVYEISYSMVNVFAVESVLFALGLLS